MLLTARKQIEVKGKTIGGGTPLVCVPIVARDQPGLMDQARRVMALGPDMIEWRADFFDGVEDTGRLTESLEMLGRIAGAVPLIFTCRDSDEGGSKRIGLRERISIINTAMSTGVPDFIDFELSSGEEAVRQAVDGARSCGRRVILSYHDFGKTPCGDVIKEKLYAAQNAGGDIAKVAVMPERAEDVLTLLEASVEARRGLVEIPVIAVAMGGIGAVTRIAGWLFGSDVTFASGEEASAPGQLPVGQLRMAIGILRESLLKEI